MNFSVVTQGSTEQTGTTWRYCQDPLLPFDPLLFDEEQLERQQLITGCAGAGRGNTCFFNYGGHPLVLRHYRRGGLVQRLSRQHYVYTGLEQTRAMREFAMLIELCRLQLPVSRPYACRVVRRGLLYRASLITHRLAGLTLVESLDGSSDSTPSMHTWSAVGKVIARLHAAGVFHADLNAHNIMLSEDGRVSLIDFDRAQRRKVPSNNPCSGWCLANIERLLRSLYKELPPSAFEAGFSVLKGQWRETLNYSISPRS